MKNRIETPAFSEIGVSLDSAKIAELERISKLPLYDLSKEINEESLKQKVKEATGGYGVAFNNGGHCILTNEQGENIATEFSMDLERHEPKLPWEEIRKLANIQKEILEGLDEMNKKEVSE